jgi:hypothetical protein
MMTDFERHQNLVNILRELFREGSRLTGDRRQHVARIASAHAWALYQDLVECGQKPVIESYPTTIQGGHGPDAVPYWADLTTVEWFLKSLNEMFPIT